jgi:hypothetical protein
VAALSGFAVSVAFKAPSVGLKATAEPRLLVDGAFGPIDNPDIKKFLFTLRKVMIGEKSQVRKPNFLRIY